MLKTIGGKSRERKKRTVSYSSEKGSLALGDLWDHQLIVLGQPKEPTKCWVSPAHMLRTEQKRENHSSMIKKKTKGLLKYCL